MREIEKCLSIVALRVVNFSLVFGGERVQQIKTMLMLPNLKLVTHTIFKKDIGKVVEL